jgi:hypothetical protein
LRWVSARPGNCFEVLRRNLTSDLDVGLQACRRVLEIHPDAYRRVLLSPPPCKTGEKRPAGVPEVFVLPAPVVERLKREWFGQYALYFTNEEFRQKLEPHRDAWDKHII